MPYLRKTAGRGRFVALAIAMLLAAITGCGDDDGVPAPGSTATVASPIIDGPVGGGAGVPFVATTVFDLAAVGYTRAEYFISGTATAYSAAAELSEDGKWTVEPNETAAFRTRILVHRPIDGNRFNGTVVVEWLNVSGGRDAAPDWIYTHTELVRSGYAWVGVSAQIVGVEGGGSMLGLPGTPLKTADPERYGTLVHPGDSFSYDIFSQAGQALRNPRGPAPLGDLRIAALLAAGESQSAFRMVTYINAIHHRARIYDGYLVHSRGGGGLSGAPLSEAPQPRIAVPAAARTRDDLDAPVLTLQTETDLTILESVAARQPDTAAFRLWEVAGTAHADTYVGGIGATDLGNSPDAARLVLTQSAVPGVTCRLPINSGPHHFVAKAALSALNRWVHLGTPPPSAPRIAASAAPPYTIERDPYGNARGGIRTPQVDVPIATLTGNGRGSIVCLLFGTTTPFDVETLAELYPTAEDYVSAFNAATDRAMQAGFILAPDAELMKAAAADVFRE